MKKKIILIAMIVLISALICMLCVGCFNTNDDDDKNQNKSEIAQFIDNWSESSNVYYQISFDDVQENDTYTYKIATNGDILAFNYVDSEKEYNVYIKVIAKNKMIMSINLSGE